MIYFIYILILLATINFNKELIDNVFSNAKEQREWHTSQFIQWAVIYGSIMLISTEWLETIIFTCFYPMLYYLGLNIRRGLKWYHKGLHDLPMWVKIILIVIGIILIIKG